jgi:ABC-type transporter Mla MlaB component
MIEHITETETGKATLRLTGELMAGDAKELHAFLVNVFEMAHIVEIDVSSTTDIDGACLQLFCASHRLATQCHKHIHLNREWSASFRETVTDLGLLRQSGCSFDATGECLWVKGQHNG